MPETVDQIASILQRPKESIQRLVDEGKLIGGPDGYSLEAARLLLECEAIEKEATAFREIVEGISLDLDPDKVERVQVEYKDGSRTGLARLAAGLSSIGGGLALIAAIGSAIAAWQSYRTSQNLLDETKKQFAVAQEIAVRNSISDTLEFLATDWPQNVALGLLQERLRTAERIQQTYGYPEVTVWTSYKADWCENLTMRMCADGQSRSRQSIEAAAPFLSEFCYSSQTMGENICLQTQ